MAVDVLLANVLPVTVFPPTVIEAIFGAAGAAVCAPIKIGT